VVKNIELGRRNKRWTQSEYGRRPDVRISPSFISLIELGRAIPNDDQRARLARALGIPPDQLLDDVDVPGATVPVVTEPTHDPEQVEIEAAAK
jgi:transcriptional regulator with XRE-family HTH domain